MVQVISDRPGVPALDRALERGVATSVVDWDEDRDRSTAALLDAVEARAEALVLAGFMRILGEEAIRRYPNRILNVHPSLLPSFPGGNAVSQALAYGAKVTGVTVHFVDEKVDHGPIVAQVPVPIEGDDDEESLHRRIQREEHRLYPGVVRALARDELTVEGRRVKWSSR